MSQNITCPECGRYFFPAVERVQYLEPCCLLAYMSEEVRYEWKEYNFHHKDAKDMAVPVLAWLSRAIHGDNPYIEKKD